MCSTRKTLTLSRTLYVDVRMIRIIGTWSSTGFVSATVNLRTYVPVCPHIHYEYYCKYRSVLLEVVLSALLSIS